MSDIRWGDVSMDNAKPCQWYFRGAPCTLLQWGMRKGQAAPAVQKVRTSDGKVHLVWLDRKGQYPGLEYELFEHQPSRA